MLSKHGEQGRSMYVGKSARSLGPLTPEMVLHCAVDHVLIHEALFAPSIAETNQPHLHTAQEL
jgi:hypothetical protein